jgi:hypothetical protein
LTTLLTFLGTNTTNFTSTNQLFLANPQIDLWRFEVVYTFVSETSSSALNFVINQPPENGSCSISPLNGTTSTLFSISCPNWFDEDGIEAYSLYGNEDCFFCSSVFLWRLSFVGYSIDRTKQTLISFSVISEFEVRLPPGDDNTSILHLFIDIRDTLDSIAEFNMSSVTVIPDSSGMNDLINIFQSSTSSLTTNPFIQLLSSGNQNTVGQVLTSLSQQFNKINIQSLQNAVSSEYQSTFKKYHFISSFFF